MTLLQTGQATTDKEFGLRVQAAIFKIAQDVLNEPEDAPNHIFRAQLALRVAQSPVAISSVFAWLCASNAAIAETVTSEGGDIQVSAPDADIEFVCSANWDIVAGFSGRVV